MNIASGKKSIGRIAAATVATATVVGGGMMAAAVPAQAATTSSITCTAASVATRYACVISGTTSQTSVTLPMSTSAGVTVPYGTYKMASGAGTMTLAKGSVTFTFYSTYTASHTAPYSFSGGFTIVLDNYHVAGPFSVTVNGKTFVTNGPGGYCGTTCSSDFVKGTFKQAWDDGDGRAHFNLVRGGDLVKVGQAITFVDQAGAGQSGCVGWVEQQGSDTTWHKVGVTATVTGGTKLTATYTPTTTGAVRLIGSCAVSGTLSSYADTGSISGVAVNATTKVTNVWANGSGVVKAAIATVTETYQVDAATITNSNAVVNIYLAADDDSRLRYRELGTLWQTAAYAKHFTEKHQYVTITVPANATSAQRIAAINKATTIGDVSTTALAGPSKATSGTFVYAWKLNTAAGAQPVDGGLAWGPTHSAPQIFFARS